jgi:uncharacterized protein (TIGR03437 family)
VKTFIVAALLSVAWSFAQIVSPIFPGPVINIIAPALDTKGHTIAFASTVTPQGKIEATNQLYVGSVKLGPSVTSLGLTTDGSRAVFADAVDNGEGVGTVDISTGAVRRMNVDTQGCVRPEAVCPVCFFACVVTPHATADGGKVLFAVQRNQPFFLVNADGTELTHLPTFTGTLAPSAQRVISDSGQVVFASSAPSGPTFAASATDVYLMNLDGTSLRNLTNFGINSAISSSNATISADGTTVVFETNYAGKGLPVEDTEIWAVQSDGSGLRQLTFGPGAATSPSISADGKILAFLQSGVVKILQPPAPPVSIATFHFSSAQSPVISGDGHSVAFLIGPANSSGGAVYQVNSDGTNLTARYAPHAVSPGGVVSAAGMRLAPSPGSLIAVYGINLAGDAMTAAAGFPLPETLAGASVLANGTKLPMLSVSPWQINAQFPQETTAQSANFQVAFQDGTVTPAEPAVIEAAAPDLFVNQIQRGDITLYQAAAFHAGTTIPADDDHPARAGQALEMYGTGLGVTEPPVSGGQPSPANPVAVAKLTLVVLIGDIEAKALFAGLTPGLAGVYQVNILVPAGLTPGRYAVTLKADGTNLGGLGTIAVE